MTRVGGSLPFWASPLTRHNGLLTRASTGAKMGGEWAKNRPDVDNSGSTPGGTFLMINDRPAAGWRVMWRWPLAGLVAFLVISYTLLSAHADSSYRVQPGDPLRCN